MAIYLGIDGGGSKTACVIGNETAVLAGGTSGGSNILRVGEQAARDSIRAAIEQACATAKVSPDTVSKTCIGVAGAARPEIADRVRKIVAQVVSGTVRVVGDMEIALAATFGGGPGVVVISGTGSIAFGRNARNETARAGGWGFAVSDEGSGHWIGRSAVAAGFHALDAGRESTLLAAALKAWQCGSRDEFVIRLNASPVPDFSTLLPVVTECADRGDDLAREVLRLAGGELARLAGNVIRRIFVDSEPVPLGMAGGVFRNSSLVKDVFYNRVRADFAHVTVNPNVVEPVDGALALARSMK